MNPDRVRRREEATLKSLENLSTKEKVKKLSEMIVSEYEKLEEVTNSWNDFLRWILPLKLLGTIFSLPKVLTEVATGSTWAIAKLAYDLGMTVLIIRFCVDTSALVDAYKAYLQREQRDESSPYSQETLQHLLQKMESNPIGIKILGKRIDYKFLKNGLIGVIAFVMMVFIIDAYYW